jgi:hypothetical protein
VVVTMCIVSEVGKASQATGSTAPWCLGRGLSRRLGQRGSNSGGKHGETINSPRSRETGDAVNRCQANK